MPFVTSKKKNFVFVHIHKTAGTSVVSRLKPHADPRTFGPNAKLGPHEQANRLQKKLNTGLWNNSFKFSFVRNPWARLHSFYHFLQIHYPKHEKVYHKIRKFVGGTPLDTEFNEWVLKCEYYARQSPGVTPIPIQRRNQLDWLTDENYENIIVDYIGKVENINRDWKVICNNIGIPHTVLPTKNQSKHRDYRKDYKPETIEFVAKHFKRDIDQFGYTFDGEDSGTN